MVRYFKVFQNSTFLMSLVGAVLLWAALAPLEWEPLGWIAPVPWIWLIRQERLPGRRPYLMLWVVGFLFWMATVHFIRLPHPATSIGWVAMSVYMGFYLPVFVALSRVGVHRCRISVLLVAPAVWTGLELIRAHLFTGITLGALAHTQYRFVPVIQIASIFGYYGVGFVVMFVAACLGRMLPRTFMSAGSRAAGTRWTLWPLFPGILIFLGVLGYGYLQLYGYSDRPEKPTVHAALIQGSIDCTMKSDKGSAEKVILHYINLSKKAVKEHKDLDLLIWPETMYKKPLLVSDEDLPMPEGWDRSEAEWKEEVQNTLFLNHQQFLQLAQLFNMPVIVGFETEEYTRDGNHFYNSCFLTQPAPKKESDMFDHRYDKMHCVLFGEYVPFTDIFPALQKLTPLDISLTPGKGAQVYEVRGIRFCPNICYENVMPHLVRRQVNELQAKGEEPDVLVTLTNDGWFWGSSALDLHLACAVFRAVECRKPMLVAANTGISAWIDATGAIRAQGPRQATDIIVAEVGPHQGSSPYLDLGDWFADLCLIFCVFLFFFSLFARLFVKKSAGPLATGNRDV